jgi:hypothetical protein
MMGTITTGAWASKRGPTSVTDSGTGLQVLFDPFSTEFISPDFIVRPGEVLVLSAFNMTKDTLAIVEKLRYGVSTMPQGVPCGGPADLNIGGQLQAEDVTQCGVWALGPCQNVGVLSLPGTYRLRLNDAAQAILGEVYIDAMRLLASEMSAVPKELYFGSVSGCNC